MRLYYLFLKSLLLESLIDPKDMTSITTYACAGYKGDMYAMALEVQGGLVSVPISTDSKGLFLSIMLCEDDQYLLKGLVGNDMVFDMCWDTAQDYYKRVLNKQVY